MVEKDTIELVEDLRDIDTYLTLRKAVDFKPLSRDQAKRALDNSLYILTAFKDGKAVGMGRIVGDGAVICYVQDLIIRPEVQGQGVGGLILETLKTFVINLGFQGTEMMFDLMCAKGRESFYKKHGFIARPTDQLGPGMIQYLKI
ncbi:MAG: GNAT family N-acetyltransferase [Lachnospiraceae bacterium]|nr:GNAT family N-acetyltransferase [Lachnospiraceae bacterium]